MYFPDANNIIASWQGKHTLHAVKEAEETVFCLESKGIETSLYSPIREVRGWVSPDSIQEKKRAQFYQMLRPLFSSDQSSIVFGLFVKKIYGENRGKAVGFLENKKFCVEFFPKEGPSFPIQKTEGFAVPKYWNLFRLSSCWLWTKEQIDACSEVILREGCLQFQSITSHIVIQMFPEGKKIIETDLGDTVMSIKEKFNKMVDGVPSYRQIRFFFNERELQNEYTLADCGIRSGSSVNVSLRRGGMSLTSFNNMEEERMVGLADDSRESLCSIHPGLNLEGKCNTRWCEAYGQTIWIRKGFGVFNMNKECQVSTCPQCKEIAIDVSNCIFTGCIYSIEGETERGRRRARCDIRAPAEKFLTYKNSMENWRKLIITTERDFSDPFPTSPFRPSFQEIPPLTLESPLLSHSSESDDEASSSSEGICTLF